MMTPVIAMLVLAAIWSVYWFVGLAVAERQTAQWRERLAGDGLRLECASESWGGYPFRFQFTCDSPSFSGPEGIRAGSKFLTVLAQAYNPWHVIVLLDGPATLAAGGGRQLEPRHGRIIGSVKIRDAQQADVSIEVPELAIPGWFSASRLLIHGRPEPEGALGLAWSISGLNYQPHGRPSLRITQSDFVGTLTRGADLVVHDIVLKEGSVVYRGTGTVRLDGSRRLSGLLNTETNDLDGLLLILDPHLDMNEQQRAALKTVLGILGQQAKIDLIAKDGEFYIGPFKAADLVPLY